VALTETLALVCYLPVGFPAPTRLRSYNRFLSVFPGVRVRLNRVILIWTRLHANQPPEVTRLKSPTSGRLRSEPQDQTRTPSLLDCEYSHPPAQSRTASLNQGTSSK